ncbi:MAG: ribonuclease T2 family protein [Tsuneonella sp.]
MKRALLLLLAVVDTPASAQSYQCRVPPTVSVPQIRPDGPPRRAPLTGYTLALSWSPEYCRGRQTRAADRIQCSGANGRFGLVVHGLWPQGQGMSPQWCAARPGPAPAEVRRNLCAMPFPATQAREWAKHGTCMSRRPETYFKIIRILWNGLRIPDLDRLSRDPALTAGAVRRAVASANRGWRADAIGVAVNERGWLEELRLCYAKDFMPTRCDKRRFGPADDRPVRIWRGL